MKYLAQALEQLPILSSGHSANLVVDTGEYRIWVSRCGQEDGETKPIQIERLINGRWTDVTEEE